LFPSLISTDKGFKAFKRINESRHTFSQPIAVFGKVRLTGHVYRVSHFFSLKQVQVHPLLS
jgi:hypothetical protein